MSEQKIALKVEHMVKKFGSLVATNDVSLEVPDGQIRAIIGPNGAGKSTLLDLITNRTKPTSGRVFFQGEEITGLSPEKIVRKGMCKCFQISKLFTNLTVFENVQIARINKAGKCYHLLPVSRSYLKDQVEECLSYVGMADKMNETAGYLSYGDQRRLEIAITLAMEPTLLMLDEPTAGVARAEGYEIMKLVKDLAATHHMTMLFIEHDMDIVFNYSDQITVLRNGTLVATGTPAEIKENSFVQEAYLGGAV